MIFHYCSHPAKESNWTAYSSALCMDGEYKTHTHTHRHTDTHTHTRTHTHTIMYSVFVYIRTSLFHKVAQSKPSKVRNLPLNQISNIPSSSMLPGVLGSAINAGNDWYTSSQCEQEQCNQSNNGTNKSTVSWLCWSC